MTEDGARFLERSMILTSLVIKHVYGYCYHFEAFAGAGFEKVGPDDRCPACGAKMPLNWEYRGSGLAEGMGGAWAAVEEACRKRYLRVSLTGSKGRYEAQLTREDTGMLVAPMLTNEYAYHALLAALVWEHLPEEERVYYLSPVNTAP